MVGYGRKDLQKRKVLSLEWKSEGVMDDESGESMEPMEEVPLIQLHGQGRIRAISARLTEGSRELIPKTRGVDSMPPKMPEVTRSLQSTSKRKGSGREDPSTANPSTAKSHQLLGDIVPQNPHRVSAPGPRCVTYGVTQLPY